jgi:G:T-mismatch repair DNA endonuclease (very short patch repair protein)
MWDDFCKLNAYTNSFEYKKLHNGITEQEFINYNSSRSVTLENLINRHGLLIGTKKWGDYIEKQKDSGCSLKYFIEKLGIEKGTIKYEEVNKNKSHNINNYVRLYGENDAEEKLLTFHSKCFGKYTQSSSAADLFNGIYECMPENYKEKCYFSPRTYEFTKYNPILKQVTKYDFVMSDIKLVIEFNGDYWYANPNKYKADDEIRGTKVSVTWNKDYQKQKLMEDLGFEYYNIWESDFLNSRNNTIEKYTNIILERINNYESTIKIS